MPPALIYLFCAQGTKGRARAGVKGRAGAALSAPVGGIEDILRAVDIGLGDEDSGGSGESRAGNADKGGAKRSGALSEDGELQVCSPTSVYHLVVD